MNRLAAAFLLSLLGAPALAQAPQAKASPAARAVEALPAELAGFRRSGPIVDFEARPGGEGLGASARYVPADGSRTIVSIIIYDGGRPRRPEGASGVDAQQQLRQASDEVQQMVRIGRYRSAAFETGMDVSPTATAGGMRCATFRVVQEDGTPTGDSVCLTVQNGRFLKVRVTTATPPEPTRAGMIASALVSAVWEAQARR